MKSGRPDWWPAAEAEIDRAMQKFSSGLREKLIEQGEKPQLVLDRANPFLMRIRAATKGDDYAQRIVDGWFTASAETRFGNLFEECALIVCRYGRQGWKSSAEGIDLEYVASGKEHVLVQVKSGISWGNSSQKAQLRKLFAAATKRLREQDRETHVRCIEGISYGVDGWEELGTHVRVCGATFWEEISNWSGTYQAIMDVVGKHSENGLQQAKQETVDDIVRFMQASRRSSE